MQTWLKSIGSAQRPITDSYTDPSVGFRKESKPGISNGDHLYLYAPGVHKRIFALVKATGNPERDDDYDPQVQGSCRWKLSVRYLINLPVADGVHIGEVRGKRHLAASIRQQSHIKLRLEESQSARRKLREYRSASIPPAVKVFPMGDGDPEVRACPDPKTLQEKFFLGTLLSSARAGRFHYQKRGLRSPPGTVVLFQFRGEIIASAILCDVERFQKPIEDNGTYYNGALHLDIDSIRVFDPVPWETVCRIWPKTKRPSHVKYDLEPPSRYTEFEKELRNVRCVGDSIGLANDIPDEVPAKIRSIINRIIRDTKMAREIKRDYDYMCQVCKQRLEIHGTPYAEAHHVKPLGGVHGGPDSRDNILCLCPNHHALFDYFAISLDPAKLLLNNHELRQSFIDYHNEQVRNRSKQSS